MATSVVATSSRTDPARGAGRRVTTISSLRRRGRALRRAAAAAVASLTMLMIAASTALAAPTGGTGNNGSDAGVAPGIGYFKGLTNWVGQYGWAGAPLAISIGGLLMAVEHHQQRTGNAIRAKGYIFAAAAGLIVISLAGTAVGLFKHIVPPPQNVAPAPTGK